MPGVPKKYCKNGHVLTEENSIYKIGEWPRNGEKQCRICTYIRHARNARMRKKKKKK